MIRLRRTDPRRTRRFPEGNGLVDVIRDSAAVRLVVLEFGDDARADFAKLLLLLTAPDSHRRKRRRLRRKDGQQAHPRAKQEIAPGGQLRSDGAPRGTGSGIESTSVIVDYPRLVPDGSAEPMPPGEGRCRTLEPVCNIYSLVAHKTPAIFRGF
jgi:hypothetical protein